MANLSAYDPFLGNFDFVLSGLDFRKLLRLLHGLQRHRTGLKVGSRDGYMASHKPARGD